MKNSISDILFLSALKHLIFELSDFLEAFVGLAMKYFGISSSWNLMASRTASLHARCAGCDFAYQSFNFVFAVSLFSLSLLNMALSELIRSRQMKIIHFTFCSFMEKT